MSSLAQQTQRQGEALAAAIETLERLHAVTPRLEDAINEPLGSDADKYTCLVEALAEYAASQDQGMAYMAVQVIPSQDKEIAMLKERIAKLEKQAKGTAKTSDV
jgi:hypothetical protein